MMTISRILVATFVVVSTALAAMTPVAETSNAEVKINGFAIPARDAEDFHTENIQGVLERAKNLGANWVSLHTNFGQSSVRGSVIIDHAEFNGHKWISPGVEDERQAVRAAHKAGLKVLLKPHVNLFSKEYWRGDIGTGMTDAEADAWFANYDAILVARARMAQEEGVEMFAIGTELTGMQRFEKQWRNTIAKVREVYKGPLTFCANHGAEGDVAWWDALDYIGIDAYYPLSTDKHPSVAALRAGWQPYLKSCAELSAKYGKKIVFGEIGYMSREDTAATPYDWKVADVRDEQVQADCFTAFFDEVYDKPWFAGEIIWMLHINPLPAGNTDYSPEGKPAGDVIKAWFDGKAK